MFERIYVEIGNICNLSCSFCQGTTRKKEQMSIEKFNDVCKKIKGYTKFVYLHVLGEPLLHKDLSDILKAIDQNNLKACITTNGTLLKQKEDILLQNSDIIHKISISLHDIEGSGINTLDRYLQDVISFSKKAAEKNIYIVFRLWNKDSSEGLGNNSQNGLIENFLRSIFIEPWQEKPRGYRLKKNIFLEYDGIFTWPSKSNSTEMEIGFCYGLSTQLAILVDGTVVPCCLDADANIPLGNIFLQNLEEILNSKRAVNIINGFKCGKLTESLCKKCTFARKFKTAQRQKLQQ